VIFGPVRRVVSRVSESIRDANPEGLFAWSVSPKFSFMLEQKAAIALEAVTDEPVARPPTPLGRVLDTAVRALDQEGIPYVLIGGVASSGLGRPRATRDIDLFVRPADASSVLRVLSKHGFTTEETDAHWIFKAFKEDVQVDVIFHTVGGIYLDGPMLDRAVEGTFEGCTVRFVPPEDLVIIKAVVHDEYSPRHWYDALGVLAARTMDWDYFIERSRRARRRVLSLLLYAQSLDIEVPNRVVRELMDRVYDS
jgi:predicted nucleotidyltransferase